MKDEIIIKVLGTVSPYTKGDMNCPGFLIEYKDQKILLDCGNGITRLLKFPDILENLHVIITHYHKDHYGDLGAIQYASFSYHNLGLLKDKVKVYLPKNEYDSNKKAIISNINSYTDYIEIVDEDIIKIDDLTIQFKNNKSHAIESFMIKIKNSNYSLVYTSDIGTTNFENLISFCHGTDLIICESSFLKKHNSSSKTHLTAYDASILASKANTKQLVLTHFWPEEDKKLYLEEAKEIFNNTEVAEEGKILVLK